jgi:hypothetical protein
MHHFLKEIPAKHALTTTSYLSNKISRKHLQSHETIPLTKILLLFQSFFLMLAGGVELERALFYLDVEGIGVDGPEFRYLQELRR